jgi:hypothetical protein
MDRVCAGFYAPAHTRCRLFPVGCCCCCRRVKWKTCLHLSRGCHSNSVCQTNPVNANCGQRLVHLKNVVEVAAKCILAREPHFNVVLKSEAHHLHSDFDHLGDRLVVRVLSQRVRRRHVNIDRVDTRVNRCAHVVLVATDVHCKLQNTDVKSKSASAIAQEVVNTGDGRDAREGHSRKGVARVVPHVSSGKRVIMMSSAAQPQQRGRKDKVRTAEDSG